METMLRIDILKTNLHKNDIEIKNILKEIFDCNSDYNKLNELNGQISKCVIQTRQDLADIETLIKSIEDSEVRHLTKTEFNSMQNQFNINMRMYRNAIAKSQQSINQNTRSKLFEYSSQVRNRFANKESSNVKNEVLSKNSVELTENLYSISRLLANEVERSGQNLDKLIASSATITETSEEFKTMSNYIANSKTLLSKYGRREFTDKILTILSFIFFFGCVMYVMINRLYFK